MRIGTSADPLRPVRGAALALSLAGAGCGVGLAHPAPSEPPPPGPRIVHHVADVPIDGRSVTLRPARVASGSGVGRLADVRLYLGGVSSHGAAAERSFDRLALVVMAARDSAAPPVLHEQRRLLLEVDGHLFRSPPILDAALYRFGRTELGFTETVFVPIDRAMLERVAAAEAVRGRIGDWLTFELSDAVRAELRSFLDAIPERAGVAEPARARTARRTWIGGA